MDGISDPRQLPHDPASHIRWGKTKEAEKPGVANKDSRGVKKPLNPILGEIFTCYWDLDDNKRAYYISEQTSHHPPKSSYFYMAPDHHIRIDGTLKPRSRFLGNSAASLMEGVAYLSFLNRGKDKAIGEQ